MSTVCDRKPLADKGNLPLSELTPNTKAKFDENIKCQLAERAARMNAAFKAQKDEPVNVAPKVPVVEKVATMKFAMKEGIAVADGAKVVVPAKVEQPKIETKVEPKIEAKVAKVSAAPSEVPAKVVAPGITPPADPPAQPKPAEPVANPQPKEEKKPVRLDGQDGLVKARLIPERKREAKKKDVKKDTIPPPRLSGDRPTRDEVPAEVRAKIEKKKPTVPPLNMNKVKQVQREERAMLQPPQAPLVAPLAPQVPVARNPAHLAGMYRDERAMLPQRPAYPGALPVHGLQGLDRLGGYGGAAAHVPGPHHRVPAPAPAPSLHGLRRPMGGVAGLPAGLVAPPRPSSFIGGAPQVRPHIDDSALARLIARQEYGAW
eukprot:TRINITY_DN33714_c0_g1_i1.p1 TRINITY_DN33714_c0_g1~~TRINITY_DN33714_c0_g1_i1.p1  ORF type:complete len:374 (+),score=120.53 TRINITY_DN33714_c0_g1_i1:83-1204(+)